MIGQRRKYICRRCGKAFTRSNTLRSHRTLYCQKSQLQRSDSTGHSDFESVCSNSSTSSHVSSPPKKQRCSSSSQSLLSINVSDQIDKASVTSPSPSRSVSTAELQQINTDSSGSVNEHPAEYEFSFEDASLSELSSCSRSNASLSSTSIVEKELLSSDESIPVFDEKGYPSRKIIDSTGALSSQHNETDEICISFYERLGIGSDSESDDDAPSVNKETVVTFDGDYDESSRNISGDVRGCVPEEAPIHYVEAKLLHLMTKYSTPLHSYRSFMDWAKVASTANYDFNQYHAFDRAMKRLTSHSSMSHNVPIITEVSAPPLPNALVHRFPFLENARRIFANPKLMKGSLWNFDGTSNVYGELNTGYWWKLADSNLQDRLGAYDVDNKHLHFVAPILFFIDGTHCDRNGRLQAEPVLTSFGNICLEMRKNSNAWFFLGLLPSKMLTPAERKKTKKGSGLRSGSIRLYHQCLRSIVKEIIELQSQDREDGKGVKVFVAGRGMLFLHFEICLVIGDTVGHDALCGHYQSYSSRIARPIRSCKVSWEDLDQTNIQCSIVSMSEIYDVVDRCMNKISRRRKVGKYRKVASSLSQNLILPVFCDLHFGGDPTGIFGATPFELLHTLLLGIIKYSLECLYTYTKVKTVSTDDPKSGEKVTTTKKSKLLKTAEFERRVRILSLSSKRQSDRQMPRAVFNTGVTTLSGIQGQEYIGLSILTIAALPGMLDDRRLETQFMDLLWKGVSVSSMLSRDEIPKTEVDSERLQMRILHYMDLFVEHCGQQRLLASPKVGTKLARLHGLSHFRHQIQHHGSPNNSNGVYLESALKTFVKHPAKRTRKTHCDFSQDLVNRWSEYASISEYINEISIEDNDIDDTRDETLTANAGEQNDDEQIHLSRKAFSYIKIGRDWNTKVGKESTRGIFHPHYDLCDVQLHALSRFLNSELRQSSVAQVDCHYELRIPQKENCPKVIFRCNPKYRGKPWFDWINVDYAAGGTVDSVPSRLLLWLSYHNHTTDCRNVCALVHSMSQQKTPKYRYLKVWNGDKLFTDAKVVSYETSVSGPTYILPGVDPTLPRTKVSEESSVIHENVLENSYFVAIPPRCKWHKLGWEAIDGEAVDCGESIDEFSSDGESTDSENECNKSDDDSQASENS